MTKEYPIALIDGDILVYRCGFASQDVSERLACSRLRRLVSDIGMASGAVTSEVFISGPTNYRTALAVTKEYKGNRKNTPKPRHYEALRRCLVEDIGAEVSMGIEADDSIGIRSQALGAGNCVVISIDKDLKMLPGDHYNFVKREFSGITPLQGLRNFMSQVVTGDRVDNIQGSGRGASRFSRVIQSLTDPSDMFDVAIRAFLPPLERVKAEPREALRASSVARVVENLSLLWILRETPQKNVVTTPVGAFVIPRGFL